ncbi:hypothetical protein D5687_01365 [Guyparkeria sp. SCN-R1]|uniref:hypothetical protein n=1 Tax=Guyparkeria sp. SCN-R1 TaxID=2341113 RepID=UPI000F64D173|nr:hypothetical protein [Guyparkeria sp. SCN-R1]RRQ24825.1 hypothetical protein D5687_01365 [Guyparkeria sp. SCN-R1]
MSTYPQRVADNILPLSLAGTLPEAFGEWFFTDNVEDHEDSEEVCQLCDQEQLRYHFEIENRNTGGRLWVGSSCILKFDVQVFEDGELLDQGMARKKLESIKNKMRLDSCIRALELVSQKESNGILSNALKYYQKNKYLTPKQAFVVLWRLKEHSIDHSASFFKVSLKRNKYKDDLRDMSLSKVHVIWPALTSAQRNLATSFGHIPPKEGI